MAADKKFNSRSFKVINDRTQMSFLIVATIAFLFCATFIEIPEKNEDNATLVIGAVISLLSSIASYLFGKKVGSQEAENGKTE